MRELRAKAGEVVSSGVQRGRTEQCFDVTASTECALILMRKILVFSLLLLTPHLRAQPRLVIEPAVLDLGQSAPANIHDTARLINVGTDSLRFLTISTNTGAMIALVSKSVLGKGDTVLLAVTYNGYNKGFGTFRKSMTIVTNEPGSGHWPEAFHHSLPVIGSICPGGSGCTRKKE